MLPKWSPETPSLLAPSQPGLLLQVLRQIAQIVVMRSVSSQQISADGALSSPCYQHKLNTGYRHRCSHPVYTALPHSASRWCRCINETCSPGYPSARSFPQRSPTILILLFRRLTQARKCLEKSLLLCCRICTADFPCEALAIDLVSLCSSSL